MALNLENEQIQIHLWYRHTEHFSEVDLTEALQVLSPVERARCDRFAFQPDVRDFAAAHALIRHALSQYEQLPPSQWVFEADPRGKPFVSANQSTWEFSIAHTRGLVACALARGAAVGIDTESLDRAADSNATAENLFSDPEILALRECHETERHTRFVELWTLKEAYLKAVGLGLSHPLDDFGFELAGSSEILFCPPAGTLAAEWHFTLFAPSKCHRIALAVRCERRPALTVTNWLEGPEAVSSSVLRMSPS